MRSTGFAYRLLRDVESQMVRLARAVLVRTAATRDILVARAGPSVTTDRFHVVTNGRDAELFHPGDGERRRAVRSELGIAHEAPLVLYIGSVGARYRTRAIGEFALELRKLRPDTRLLVLSGSPETARTELIEALPDLAAFTTITRANPADVSRIASAADVGTALIRPSFSTQGISPVKTAEYLLCGVPVLGTAEVGDNQTALAQGVFFDEQRGLDKGARWVAETVLPEREAFRQRARRVGVDRFSLDRSVCDYRIALEAMKASLA
jgi:glycosyltransferase involved in cell wall biosynthesis